MKPDADLISDLFSSQSELREQTLAATLGYVAKRNRRRKRLQVAAACLIVSMGGLLGLSRMQSATSATASRSIAATIHAAAVVPGTSIHLLTDEELFRMFPGRPAAIVGTGDNRQFVLLDEQQPSDTSNVN